MAVEPCVAREGRQRGRKTARRTADNFHMTKVIFLILLFATTVAPAADITVTDNTTLKKAVKSLQPGDTVILSDGTWRDTEIKLIVDGSEDKPITLRAQTPGKVV